MKKTNARILRQLSLWVVPFVISAAALFGFTAITRADTPPSSNELAEYLQTNQLEVGAESVADYQQIYYLYDGKKIFITGAKHNHTSPVAHGQYVVWQGTVNGANQIFRLNVITNDFVQLTSVGTNQNPSVHDGFVVWETWVNERWAIAYYDGLRVTQLTDGSASAVRPITDGKQIVFAQAETPDWKAYSYDIATREFTVLAQGDEQATAFPAFGEADTITTDFAQYQSN